MLPFQSLPSQRRRLYRLLYAIRKRFLPRTLLSPTRKALHLGACLPPFLLLVFVVLMLLARKAFNVGPPFVHRIEPYDSHVLHAVRQNWPSRPVSEELREEFWEKAKHDVVVGIKTGHEVSYSRLTKLKNFGWWSVGRDVPNVVVISDSDDLSLGIVSIKQYAVHLLLNQSQSTNATNLTNATAIHSTQNTTASTAQETVSMPSHWFDKTGWRGDKDKNLPTLHLMRRLYPNKKWYLLLDDDTYIFLENFARYILQEGMDDRPIYTGKVFYISRCGGFARDGTWMANKSEPRGMFAHGGSGIVLNRQAIDALFPHVPQCIRDYSSCWAGDMQVGLCLRRAGVAVRRLQPGNAFEKHFTPFWPSKAMSDRRYSSRWHSMDEPLTFHKLPDREMQLLSQYEKSVLRSGDTVIYSDLLQHLLQNGVVPAHSNRDRKNRYFSSEFLPKHLK